MKAGSEAAFQVAVTNLARYCGWGWIFHPPDNRPVKTASGRVIKQNVAPGFPDLTLLRPPEHLFVELKAEKGRVSPEQQSWHAALRACGFEVAVWRPSDWPAIEARLKRPLVVAA